MLILDSMFYPAFFELEKAVKVSIRLRFEIEMLKAQKRFENFGKFGDCER